MNPVAIIGTGVGKPRGPSIGPPSNMGSAQSASSKVPPQVPISAQRRKILAAQQAAVKNIMQVAPAQAEAMQNLHVISPEQITRPNGMRYSIGQE